MGCRDFVISGLGVEGLGYPKLGVQVSRATAGTSSRSKPPPGHGSYNVADVIIAAN